MRIKGTLSQSFFVISLYEIMMKEAIVLHDCLQSTDDHSFALCMLMITKTGSNFLLRVVVGCAQLESAAGQRCV
jgi:hypothetical protein